MAAGPGWTSSAARPVLPVRSSLSLTEALLVALSQLDRAGCVEVFGGNDVVADVLVAQWLADDDLRLSNCSREELVTLDVESCRVVTLDVWGSLVLSAHGTHACGCYGGSLWRMRYGKRPKQMKNGLLSVILAYFDRPKLPPIWSPLEVDPDVEILRLQYMGERFRSTRPCYHTQYINCYLALTSSEAKLIRLTPSVNPNREIALSTYRTDREQSLCRFFCNQHGSMLAATAGRLCALPQSRSLEATGTIARWQSCGAAQSSAGVSGSVFNVRRLLDTSRGASLFCANLPNMRLEGSAESDFTILAWVQVVAPQRLEKMRPEKSQTVRSETTIKSAMTKKTLDDDKTSRASGDTAMQKPDVTEVAEGGNVTVLGLLLHPSAIPKLMLQSVAGSYWLACRRQLSLAPLRFLDPELEKYYTDLSAAKYSVRLTLTIWMFVFASAVSWVLVWYAYREHWVEVIDTLVEKLNHLFTGAAIVINILFWVVMYFNLGKVTGVMRKHIEYAFYMNGLIYTGLIGAWGTAAVIRTAGMRDWDWLAMVADLSWPLMGELQNWALQMVCNIVYAYELKKFYEVKMLADGITTTLFFTQIVLVDAVLPTKSSRSALFHLVMVGTFIGMRTAQGKALMVSQLRAANYIDMGYMFLVYCIGFMARWFRELQERSNIVRVRESQSRLQSVKERSKKRRFDMSAAEEVMDLVKNVQETVRAQHNARKAKGGPNSLYEVLECLQAVLDLLAQNEKVAKADVAFDPAKADDEIKEDAFINMYRLDKRAGTEHATMARKPRTGHGVKFEMETAPQITVDEVTFDAPTMLAKIAGDVGQTLDLRVLELAKDNPAIIMDIGYLLLGPYKQFLDVSDQCILGFLYGIYKNHWTSNPYHNSVHAANVAHVAMTLMNAVRITDYCSEEQIVAYVTAGLGHCIGHSGRNNLFYIQGDSLLAFAQNDNAVLETTTCFMIQSLMASQEDINILSKLSRDELMTTRKFLVEFLLALDMSRHFEMVSKSRVRRASPEFNPIDDVNDRDMAVQMLFKMADLGHAVLDWPAHLDWTLRLQEEFYQQGAEENEKGMPISPLCDRSLHSAFARTQAGYMQLIILPLVDEVSSYAAEAETLVQANTRALFNKQKWEGLRDSKKSPPVPTEAQTETAPSKYTIWCLFNLMKSKRFADVVKEPTVPMIART
ncbi:putative phosphodiesterase [Gregarina niphandrodes]|uniref:Phosphodiesterase n=1 Tax=Gregarina niphandrodes TaxID=110365 RepID=A0A023B5L4_GRENI|nr:putative phosphodiesterase [Gregarina niphandrodes]EZG61398.1 putative phosphodiesterase [Gregarina niphandrodes]|eukprot:XP_011130758.1 putative phosphodiesterase [Gregarina niphandrodes]